jgi:hypothetical protein
MPSRLGIRWGRDGGGAEAADLRDTELDALLSDPIADGTGDVADIFIALRLLAQIRDSTRCNGSAIAAR